MKCHKWVASRGYRLSAMVHMSEEVLPRDKPIIIFCHGFTGDKVGANQLMLNLAKGIEGIGCTLIRFDFAGSGESEGTFAADTSIKGWQEDLGNVIDWLRDEFNDALPPIYLLGHSLGGLIVLMCDRPEVSGRITLAPVVHPIENFREVILGPYLWSQSQQGNTISNFYGKGYSLAPSFVQDLLQFDYTPLSKAADYIAPLLIVHGKQDAAVPLTGSEELYQQYNGSKKIHVTEADHVFTGRHQMVAELISEWLLEQKKGK